MQQTTATDRPTRGLKPPAQLLDERLQLAPASRDPLQLGHPRSVPAIWWRIRTATGGCRTLATGAAEPENRPSRRVRRSSPWTAAADQRERGKARAHQPT
ncbi:hypothetical protein ABZ137_24185 [Streptomyces bobili]|uniref:hypothetical protein n=1 Tax=Streptomyces bobili TaxID=67280 RepID=UPI0033AD9BE1